MNEKDQVLKPCPFCGGKPYISTRPCYYGETISAAIVCKGCGASSDHEKTETKAIIAWNTRFNNDGE